MAGLNKKRNDDGRIVNLRALAILIVVIGHSIILYDTSWNFFETTRSVPALDVLKDWINLVQMPLFFSFSGYLFYYSLAHSHFNEFFKGKIQRILIPFFAFAFLWMVPIRMFLHWKPYVDKSIADIVINDIILGRDCGHLWYLQCLFVIFLFSYGVCRILEKWISNKNLKNVILFVIAYSIAYFFYLIPMFPGAEIIRSVAMNWIWFCVGYILCQYKQKIEIYSNYKFIWSVIGIGISFLTLMGVFPYRRITQLLLLVIFYLIIPKNAGRVEKLLGDYSFGIYLFHSPLVYITYSFIPNANPAIVVLLNFIIFGGLAVILTGLIRQSRFRILIGEKSKRG